MSRPDVFLRLLALLATGAVVSCSAEALAPTQRDGASAGGADLRAGATPGTYALSFWRSTPGGLDSVSSLEVSTVELILGAHIASQSGAPAQKGTVTFQYCSFKGLPPNDIDRADEAPSAHCRDGTATWKTLASASVNSSGDAFIFFGIVQIPRTVGFRCRYQPQGSDIASGLCPERDFTWTGAGGSLLAAAAISNVTAPEGLTASAPSETRIDLAWWDRSKNESGFQVHRAANEVGPFTSTATVSAGVTVFADQGLAAGTRHCYRVRAFRVTGSATAYSEFSNTACATTLVPPPPPPPPPPAPASGATATPSTSSSLALVAWTDNSTNEAVFRIERSLDAGASWSLAVSTSADAVSLNVDAVAEQQMCYRVIAANAGGEAAPSNTACTTTPAGPANLSATRLDAELVELTWSDNSAVEGGYQVWLLQANCIGICNAFDPICTMTEYEVCGEERVIAVLPANSTRFTVNTAQLFSGGVFYPYRLFYVVATKDGGSSDPSSMVAVP